MGNINYSRATPLRRRGMNIDLILHPSDDSIFAQPGWEDFDGSIEGVRRGPGSHAGGARSSLLGVSPQPGQQLAAKYRPLQGCNAQANFDVAEYMPFLPTFEALSEYDALLVSQFPYLGLAFRSSISLWTDTVGTSGLKPARNDQVGIISRRGIENAYAILVSNPITLAHAPPLWHAEFALCPVDP